MKRKAPKGFSAARREGSIEGISSFFLFLGTDLTELCLLINKNLKSV